MTYTPRSVVDALARRLADESFRHSWDMSDERQIGGVWVRGLCCECGEFVPYGDEVAHVAAAFARVIPPEVGQLLWALGPTLAAARVQALLSAHLETEHPEWNS